MSNIPKAENLKTFCIVPVVQGWQFPFSELLLWGAPPLSPSAGFCLPGLFSFAHESLSFRRRI
ncbi:MAG: hypothetical protein H6559_34445 [Lewinellaceae bacterium]|nr:hypothetical protein [Lewinellaceae bacterium]